jgi:hypothetical protein
MPVAAPPVGTSIAASVSAEPPNGLRSSLTVRCCAAPSRRAIALAAASSAAWRWP